MAAAAGEGGQAAVEGADPAAAAPLDAMAAPDRLRRAEAILRLRTDRVAVVLECPSSVSPQALRVCRSRCARTRSTSHLHRT